tara:strand:- start:2211 stop:2681 length:471 start_codon:yes stop_codon:yes gene_type:complete
MSVDTERTWFYEIKGRKIHLWKWVRNASVDTLGGYKIRTPEDHSGPSLIYPDEAITNGLRFEYSGIGDAFVVQDPTETVDSSLTTVSSPSESSYVNLNRMLCLAVIDYLKSQMEENKGDLQKKEYYMREFWKKVSDNQSNKKKVNITFPTTPFAVK